MSSTHAWSPNIAGKGITAFQQADFVPLTLLYVIALTYVSLVLGPLGYHYVPISLSDAWDRMLSIRFIDHAADQRPDWMANLVMLVPMGFLLRSSLGLGSKADQVLKVQVSWIICFGIIIGLKFLQLYFPPRTVTLNYIAAQTIGATLGIVAAQIFPGWLYPGVQRRIANGEGLVVLLGIYTLWLVLYFLMPFDFALTLGEMRDHFAVLPYALMTAPGYGMSCAFRVLLILAGTLACFPIGLFLSLIGRGQTWFIRLALGFGLVATTHFFSLFVISGTPYLGALIYRTIGVALGILFMEWLKGKDLRKRHYYFGQFVPLIAPVYIIFILYINGLVHMQWLSLADAQGQFDQRLLLPFWNHYIVSKAQAARSTVVHAAMFAPIATMVWLSRGFLARGALLSGFLAFILSMITEIGRWLSPGCAQIFPTRLSRLRPLPSFSGPCRCSG